MSRAGDSVRELALDAAATNAWFDYSPGALWDMVVTNGLQVVAVAVAGWLIATWFERLHLKSLSLRETPLQHISVVTRKKPPACEAEACTLLIGSVVLAHDYFRTFIISLRRLIGGNVKAYERLLQRGRREALIRLKEEADLRGLDKIVNVRFCTSGFSGRFLHALEVVAYGTGVRTVKEAGSTPVIPAQAGMTFA